MNARECYQLLARRLDAGEPTATATVVRTWGSTPREPGAKMLVYPDGRNRGTVGGGCGEAEVLEVAVSMLEAGAKGTRRVVVDLTEDLLEGEDRVCGGRMLVLVECWREATRELETLLERSGEGTVRVTRVTDTADAAGSFVPAGGQDSAFIEEQIVKAHQERRSHHASSGSGQEELDLFFEFISGMDMLLICGAGHIAQPLSTLGKMLEYRVTIIDDRPAFASLERFPAADRVIARPFDEALDQLEINEHTSAILVTRGHRHDEFCLRRILHTPAHYVGMLGSKRRVKAVFLSLLDDGYTLEQISRVYAPIGLELGALTPDEIAVSIAAELIALERGRLGGHMRLANLERLEPELARAKAKKRCT